MAESGEVVRRMGKRVEGHQQARMETFDLDE